MTSPVSPATEQRLREAMQRLFNGEPRRTDGKLTKNNLWREAGVSRATMNRAAEILAEWDARVSDSPAGAARGNATKSSTTCTAAACEPAAKNATSCKTRSTPPPP